MPKKRIRSWRRAYLGLGDHVNLLGKPRFGQGVGERVQRRTLPVPKDDQVNVAAKETHRIDTDRWAGKASHGDTTGLRLPTLEGAMRKNKKDWGAAHIHSGVSTT